MHPLDLCVRVCVSAILLTACGTSSSNDGVSGDGGGDGALASDTAPQCYPFASPACAKGQTCCFSGTSGTCKDLSGCESTVQFECQSPGGCNLGQECCITVPPAPGLDLSALSQDGGVEGGLGHLLMGVTATSFCSNSCSAPGAPICGTSADCAGGALCGPLPEGNLVLAVVGAETIGVCATADGGAPPREGGASESGGSDGAVSDAAGGD